MISKEQFTDIYTQYVDKIYRFIFIKVNSPEVAQDLTSETFTKILEHFKRNSEGGSHVENPGAFLYGAARNVVYDYYRQKGKSHVLLSDENSFILDKESPDHYRADYAVSKEDNSRQIRNALSKMSDDYRELLTLRYIEDMSAKEISEILKKPQGTIRVMLHRGLKELREILEA